MLYSDQQTKEAKFVTFVWESPKLLTVHAINNLKDKHLILTIFTPDYDNPPFALNEAKLTYNDVAVNSGHKFNTEFKAKVGDNVSLDFGLGVLLKGRLEASLEEDFTYKLVGHAYWRKQGT